MKNDNQLTQLYQEATLRNKIEAELYKTYNVKKGLRNENKTGVLVGLTKICDVVGYKMDDNQKTAVAGQLFYRGIDLSDIIDNCTFRPGTFEETCFLLLFGKLPTAVEYQNFTDYLKAHYVLPENFTNINILRLPASNLMNKIQRALLMLYEYDEQAEDSSPENTLFQGLNILAKLPAIISYSYYGMIHARNQGPLILNLPQTNLTIAENILALLRDDQKFHPSEAEVLDVIMTLHADHGGGNNSTFANIVLASTETDLYSALSAAVGSLKGPKHGGANEKVGNMMKEAIDHLGIQPSKEAITNYIAKILNKEVFDKSGLLYGFGHAIYTISDPRAVILSAYCEKLSALKKQEEKYAFYRLFEETAIDYFQKIKETNFCANLDFYSGLAYELLDIPAEIALPIFAASRTIGWLAHNIENKLYCNKIIRPATKFIGEYHPYTKLEER